MRHVPLSQREVLLAAEERVMDIEDGGVFCGEHPGHENVELDELSFWCPVDGSEVSSFIIKDPHINRLILQNVKIKRR